MSILDATVSKPRDGGPSFSVKNRLERAAWRVVWTAFGTWTPTPLHAWRRFLVRLFGGHVHRSAKIYPGVKIWLPRHLTMSAHACLAPGAICYSMAEVRLKEYALISQRAHLCCGTHDIRNADFQLIAKPIEIGANAWVAAEAFVGPGVTIGEGAVLGARGVAVKPLAPWTVYVGNPARAVGIRAMH